MRLAHPTPLQRLAFLAALAVMASVASATVRINSDGKTEYRVFTGIRPNVVFCVDNICDHLTPAEARHIASALTIAAQEREAKK